MVEVGTCRARSANAVLTMNLMDLCVGVVAFWLVGYGLAFGDLQKNHVVGVKYFMGREFSQSSSSGQVTPYLTADGGRTVYADWFFQCSFCCLAATIVGGGVAERVQMRGYMVYSLFMSAVICPVIMGWTRGGGWLNTKVYSNTAFHDLAGSGFVHLVGGTGALVGALVAGPRPGFKDDPKNFYPHNVPLVALGTFLLWFGWYGLSCGSTVVSGSTDGSHAALAAMNTTIAAAVGGLVVLLVRLAARKRYDIIFMCRGIVAGLVAISAGAGNVDVGSAAAIGAVGALVFLGSSALVASLGIDDPVDAFSVHGAVGIWGVLAAVLFDWGDGFSEFNGGLACRANTTGTCLSDAWQKVLIVNAIMVAVIIGWVAFWTLLVMVPLRLVNWLRNTDKILEEGVDWERHLPPKAYDQIEPLSEI